MAMQVKVYEINTTDGKRYGLKNAKHDYILPSAVSKWKTRKGAENYAAKRGFELV